jgi:hypothetical protein
VPPLVLIGSLRPNSRSLLPLLSDVPSEWHHDHIPTAPSQKSLENTAHPSTGTICAFH